MSSSCQQLNTTSLLDVVGSPGKLNLYSVAELQQMQNEARASISILSSRCLYFASKWCADLLSTIVGQIQAQLASNVDVGVDAIQLVNETFALNASPSDPLASKNWYNKKKTNTKTKVNAEQLRLEQETQKMSSHCLLSKTYFDLKQYQRAAHVLEKRRTKMLKADPDALESNCNAFLRCYALYLDGERKKEESQMEANTDFEKAQASNPNLGKLHKELGVRHRESRLDSFGMFLFAIICSQLHETDRARELLIMSINQYPLNWSAWQLLAELIPVSVSATHNSTYIAGLLLSHKRLENHFMKQFFVVYTMVVQCEHLFEPRLVEMFLLKVKNKFSSCNDWQWMLSQLALMYYNYNRFEDAIKVFQIILREDPYATELLDIYSNMLYVTNRKTELSSLAHTCMEVNQYSAETCCVVGNYYSMYGMHEKAILYFERALRLNGHFLSAYVLMGHEYIELRNMPAAIQSYRRALDMSTVSSVGGERTTSPDDDGTIGRPDYRALYGLGQTYELLQMPSYAIFYFSRVCKLKPYDPRMWSALAQCYHNLGKRSLAIKCYERALSNHVQKHQQQPQRDARVVSSVRDYDSNYLMVVLRLAQLYHELSPSKSYRKYKKYVQHVDTLGKFPDGSTLSDEMGEALHRLAEHELRKHNIEDCKKYAQRLYQQSAKFKSVAHKILNHCNSTSFANNGMEFSE